MAAVHAAEPATSAGFRERLRSRREYTMLKKVVRLLQDNRVDTGDGETAQRLQEINQNQTDSYPILKTILNGLFITTGVVLLVGVVVVIIYTSLGSLHMSVVVRRYLAGELFVSCAQPAAVG